MDLVVAIIIVGCCCGTALIAGVVLASQTSHQVRWSAQIATAVSLVGYLVFLWDRPLLATMLPFSGLIVFSNWLPVMGTFLVGMYLATQTVSVVRRRLLGGTTVALAAWSVVAPTFGQVPECRFRLQSGMLQFQSTPHTCSAACAASLLNLHGIQAAEQEMAELCLTRQGTHWMGLYRGLKLKTAGTGWAVAVEPFSAQSVAGLTRVPAILAINIDTSQMPDDVDHGFLAGAGHSVVALGTSDNQFVNVFDPSPEFGLEAWDHEMLQHIRNGVILKLVPQDRILERAAEVTENIRDAQRRTWFAAAR